MLPSNTNCPVCKKWYRTEQGGNITCKQCASVAEKDREKVKNTLKEASFILETQNKLKLYAPRIAKILVTPKLIRDHKRCNPTEMIVLLEINRLKWDIDYQWYDDINKFRYDFLIREFGIVIEIDEKYHDSKSQKAKDAIRDEKTKAIGFKIIRIPEQVIRANINNFTTIVLEAIVSRYKFLDYEHFKKRMDKVGIEEPFYKNKYEKVNAWKKYALKLF